MAAAAIASAAMSFSMMMAFFMVVTMDVWIIGKPSCKECLYRLVRTSGYAAVKPDLCICQSRLRSGADPAADQKIHLHAGEQSGQSAVAAPLCAHHLRIHDLPVFDLIDFKVLCMPKMWEYVSVS